MRNVFEKIVSDFVDVLGYFAERTDTGISAVITVWANPMTKMIAVFIILWLVIILL